MSQVLDAERLTAVSAIFYEIEAPDAKLPVFIPVKVPMKMAGKIDGTPYTLFSLAYARTTSNHTHPFDVVAEGPDLTLANTFNGWFNFPGSPTADN